MYEIQCLDGKIDQTRPREATLLDIYDVVETLLLQGVPFIFTIQGSKLANCLNISYNVEILNEGIIEMERFDIKLGTITLDGVEAIASGALIRITAKNSAGLEASSQGWSGHSTDITSKYQLLLQGNHLFLRRDEQPFLLIA